VSQVLIVDDDPNQRRLLTWEFSDEGYVVDTATDGREALQKMKVALPDVVVLDLAMQGMNGIDTVSQILNLQTRPAVVIYSAHERCRSNLVMKTTDDFVLKSSDLAPLKASVRKAARRSQIAA
jgi:DNA-binding response OmpR family regulator